MATLNERIALVKHALKTETQAKGIALACGLKITHVWNTLRKLESAHMVETVKRPDGSRLWFLIDHKPVDVRALKGRVIALQAELVLVLDAINRLE